MRERPIKETVYKLEKLESGWFQIVKGVMLQEKAIDENAALQKIWQIEGSNPIYFYVADKDLNISRVCRDVL